MTTPDMDKLAPLILAAKRARAGARVALDLRDQAQDHYLKAVTECNRADATLEAAVGVPRIEDRVLMVLATAAETHMDQTQTDAMFERDYGKAEHGPAEAAEQHDHYEDNPQRCAADRWRDGEER